IIPLPDNTTAGEIHFRNTKNLLIKNNIFKTKLNTTQISIKIVDISETSLPSSGISIVDNIFDGYEHKVINISGEKNKYIEIITIKNNSFMGVEALEGDVISAYNCTKLSIKENDFKNYSRIAYTNGCEKVDILENTVSSINSIVLSVDSLLTDDSSIAIIKNQGKLNYNIGSVDFKTVISLNNNFSVSGLYRVMTLDNTRSLLFSNNIIRKYTDGKVEYVFQERNLFSTEGFVSNNIFGGY